MKIENAKIMKVRATWEFEVDVTDFIPKYVNVPGLAVDLTREELNSCIERGDINGDDFEYSVVIEWGDRDG